MPPTADITHARDQVRVGTRDWSSPPRCNNSRSKRTSERSVLPRCLCPDRLRIEAGSTDIDIDMSQVTFCDSTQLHALLYAYRRLLDCHRRMRIINASPQVLRLLELTGITAQLTQH